MPETASIINKTARGAGGLRELVERVAAGEAFRNAFEDYLAQLSPAEAHRAEWGSRESVGAAALMANATIPGPVLVLGSAFLGTSPALAALGREVAVADTSEDRIRFAQARAASGGLAIRGIVTNGTPPLDAPDGAFSLVMIPDAPAGLPVASHEARPELRAWFREARRLLTNGGELVFLASNRFAYKRFTGHHGRFEHAARAGRLRAMIENRGGERTLRGYERMLRDEGFETTQELAAYVSHLDYHYLSRLAPRARPALELGRKERKNLAKWIGYELGLFRFLAPSFVIVARAGNAGSNTTKTWIQRIAESACERAFGEARGVSVDHLLATRGNAAIALASSDRGGVVARVPLCPKEVRLGNKHFEAIDALRRRFPNVPVPRAIAKEVAQGAIVYIEERLAGRNAAQFTGGAHNMNNDRGRTYLQLADLLAGLAAERRADGSPGIEEVLHARARMVASRLRDRAVADGVLRAARRIGELLAKKTVPLVLAHGDLRAKHCLVNDRGDVTGLLDWGTYREPNLPLFDLLHFIIHDRKQQFDEPLDAAALRALHPRAFRPAEEAAVERYCGRLRIDGDVRRACELAYPIEVAATAFYNWDYDRPRWVETNFARVIAKAAGD